ncbi:putative protein kinase RLK-Pelle-LRR-III family [Helianthus annuus]|nr:putative protein kinase RLK-Pelle-LRR-III family [Helianthus annuus]KAJ0760357.1 putative protein kinase RLK-Pelle-LRR-III family [Helianthus annuus]KAJ0930150.1 putative protein kinase RLK-Pelle-LRR-III family [Helianthus annuus]
MKSTSLNNFILIILTFYTPNTSSSPLNSTSTPQNDAVSLLSFKSTADLNNNLPYSINKTSNVCNWTGVQCGSNRKVSRLVLENLNLSGTFASNTLTQLDQLRVLSLRNNSLTGPIPNLAGLVNLKVLYLDHNYFTGQIPVSISYIHRLRTLDLSYNKLTGEIPVQLSDLDRLNYLRLDSNRFNGSIPPFNQSSLEVFNVSVNFLTGSVPTTPTLLKFGPDLFSINPHLCGEVVRTKCSTQKAYFSGNTTKQQQSSSSSPESFAASKSSKHKRIALIIGVSASFLVFITTILCVMLLIKSSEERRRKEVVTAREMMELAEAADAAAEVMRMQEANELEKKVKKLHQGMEMRKSGNLVFYAGEPEVYTVEQLMRASAELLGGGTVGTTYKALVDNRVVVCVKRLDSSRLSGMTSEVFARRMEVLGGVRHPNVVVLRAYFQTEEEKLLVYDYQPNGSLFSLVHGSKSTTAKPLHWTSCLKIAEDVAQGLWYLHETCNLVHGNLKSSNILLGSDFEARLSDYCLSALFHHVPDSNNHGSTAYNPPETEKLDEPTAKSDVYSFGIVMLELLTGKSASEHPELTAGDVVRWVKSSRGEGVKMEEKRLEMMAEVAVACRVRSPEMRPTMWQVIKMLQEIKEAAVMEDCGLEL